MSVTIRPAAERDLDVLVEFEIRIARISFDDRAVTDPAVHRQRVAKGLERDPGSAFVAVDEDDRAIGWLWMAVNTNFVTHERYGNLRSLAVADGPHASTASEALLARALQYAGEHDLPELTGKVHVANTSMRTLYRGFGFEPVSLTMRWDRDAAP